MSLSWLRVGSKNSFQVSNQIKYFKNFKTKIYLIGIKLKTVEILFSQVVDTFKGSCLKSIRKEITTKIKNIFKPNKLILHVISDLFFSKIFLEHVKIGQI